MVFFVGLVVIGLFLFAGSGLYGNIVGMVASDATMYECSDNDGRNTYPQKTHGVVRVTTPSTGNMEVFTDECVDEITVKEYSCDRNTNREMVTEYACTDLGTKCRQGRCSPG